MADNTTDKLKRYYPRRGPATHRTIGCPDCGGRMLVPRQLVGSTRCTECGVKFRVRLKNDARVRGGGDGRVKLGVRRKPKP
jgi:ribosomal protein L37AE/L43A